MWDGEPSERSLDSRCQRGTAVFAVACPLCGTSENCGARDNISETGGAARLRRAAGDSEFANSLLEGGTLHSKMSPDELAKVR